VAVVAAGSRRHNRQSWELFAAVVRCFQPRIHSSLSYKLVAPSNQNTFFGISSHLRLRFILFFMLHHAPLNWQQQILKLTARKGKESMPFGTTAAGFTSNLLAWQSPLLHYVLRNRGHAPP
jgi:hypothetical protein